MGVPAAGEPVAGAAGEGASRATVGGGVVRIGCVASVDRRSKRFYLLSSDGESVSWAGEALRAGAVDFLQKPFSPQSLLERIQEALAIDLDRLHRQALARANNILVIMMGVATLPAIPPSCSSTGSLQTLQP